MAAKSYRLFSHRGTPLALFLRREELAWVGVGVVLGLGSGSWLTRGLWLGLGIGLGRGFGLWLGFEATSWPVYLCMGRAHGPKRPGRPG